MVLYVNGMVTPVVPSDAGKDFAVDTMLLFLFTDSHKQALLRNKNAAVVEIDERKNNHLMVHSNGVIVINKTIEKI